MNDFSFLNEKEKQEVYLKYSLEDFWKWWSDDDKNAIMEISFPQLNYHAVKAISNKLGLPQNKTSVFVNNHVQLLQILKSRILKKTNIYWGINPRKEIFQTYEVNGKKFTKKVYGNNNIGVKAIRHILIDIDSEKINGNNVTAESLQETCKLAVKLLDKLKNKNGFDNYILLCSANGIHIILKLDEEIFMPELEYKVFNDIVIYEETEEFNYLKSVIKRSIGQAIKSLVKDTKSEIDNVWDLRRVSRLPYSLNIKIKNDIKFCGILRINNGTTIGMKKLILSTPKEKIIKSNAPIKYKVTKEKLKDEPFIKLLMTKNLPSGDRNHYLELSLSQLLNDNGINHREIEVQHVVKQIQITQRKSLIQVDPKYLPANSHFSTETINAYCWNHGISFLYPILKNNSKINVILDLPFKTKLQSKDPEILKILKQEMFDYVNIKKLVKLVKKEFKHYIWGEYRSADLFLYNNLSEDIHKRMCNSGLLLALLEKIY